jgi:hypothetical protein
MISSINDIFTVNCAMIIPYGVNTNFSPELESHAPKEVVPNMSRSPTPATIGGNASGRSTTVWMSVFPKKS